MKKIIKSSVLLLLSVLMLCQPQLLVHAEGSSNYSQDANGRYVEAPVAYEVERVYYAGDFDGVDILSNLSSMFVTEDSVYVAYASGILVLDHSMNLQRILSEYTAEDGSQGVIKSPDGIFVTDDGTLYVCEPDSAHILVFDRDFNLLHDFGKPTSLDLDVAYKPSQIVVDSLGRMYVIATNVYEGILELSADNVYQRYFGTTTVAISPLDVFFRSIASEAQLTRQSLVLPTEYSSMSVDSRGFIYTTIRSTDVDDPVRLLNVNGDDILPEDWQGERPVGDTEYDMAGTVSGPSSLSYIDCNDYGMYMALDSMRKRVFTYDENSNMLFVFGGNGDKDGCFRNPVSVRWIEGDRVLVADRLSQSITVMKPTRYAQAIINAAKYEFDGDRATAVTYWQEALSMNANYVLAQNQIGKASYWNGDYDTAMDMLERTNYNEYYSMAFGKVREGLVRQYATPVVIGIAVLIVAGVVIRRIRRQRKEGGGYATEA